MKISDVKIGDVIVYQSQVILRFKGIGSMYRSLELSISGCHVRENWYEFTQPSLTMATPEEIIWYEGAVQDYQQKVPIRTKEQALALHKSLNISKSGQLTSPPKEGDIIVYKSNYDECLLIYPGNDRDAKAVKLSKKLLENHEWNLSNQCFYSRVRYATQDEIHLLKTCLAAGKYVEPQSLSQTKVTKFVLNEYYVRKSKSGVVEWIFRADKIASDCAKESPYINVSDNKYSSGGNCSGNFNIALGEHYLATPDQRAHLDACIKATKYVTWVQAQELSFIDHHRQIREAFKEQLTDLKPKQLIYEQESNNPRPGSSYKAVEPLPRITTRERPRGNVRSGRISPSRLAVGHLSHQVSSN
jgi:hypothetical protein